MLIAFPVHVNMNLILTPNEGINTYILTANKFSMTWLSTIMLLSDLFFNSTDKLQSTNVNTVQ